MRRAGKVIAERRPLYDTFEDSDARDHDAQGSVLATMDQAVAAAAAAYGDDLSRARRSRLALTLKQIWFCGGDQQSGSRMKISVLRTKLGAAAVGERQTKYDLQLLVLWELLVVRRKLRGVTRRVNKPLVDQLVAASRASAHLEKRTALVDPKTAPLDAQDCTAPLKSCTCRRPKVPPVNKSALESAIKKRAATHWPDVVGLLGEQTAADAAGRLSDFKRELLRRRVASGDEIPESLVDDLLQRALEAATDG